MKLKKTILLITSLTLCVACQTITDPLTGKSSKQLTPEAKAVLSSIGDVTAQALASAAVTAATSAATQYTTTGKVNSKELTSNVLYGLANNTQGYVGQVMTAAQLAKVTGVPAVANVSSSPLVVTQETVNALQAAAAVQNIPKS